VPRLGAKARPGSFTARRPGSSILVLIFGIACRPRESLEPKNQTTHRASVVGVSRRLRREAHVLRHCRRLRLGGRKSIVQHVAGHS
jgi:hypothetical protein